MKVVKCAKILNFTLEMIKFIKKIEFYHVSGKVGQEK